mmetsp:Transcript_9023/g.25003  ORF Transcript_9023/g.25003 Transcript_9023/m.25003 type:complete len:392 (+) Transcript_9023:70-1245(+)
MNMRPEQAQLFQAANNGDLTVIQRLVTTNPSINLDCTVPNGPTPLCCASFYGHLHVVEFLISRSAVVDKPSSDNYSVTPIYAACQQGHEEIVRFLVESGADYRKRCWTTSFSPLEIASLMGHETVVRCLAQKIGSDVLNGNSGEGKRAFVLAFSKEHYGVMECLAKEHGISLDFRLPNGTTPLTHACRKGNLELVEFLLKMGASKDLTTEEPPMTRFFSSVMNGIRSAINSWFIPTTSSPHAVNFHYTPSKGNGFSPLLEAVSNSHVEVVQELLRHGASPSSQQDSPFNPLVLAVENGSLEITRELLDHGAKVGGRGNSDNGALIAACRLGNTLIAQLLMERGADCRKKFQEGRTKEARSALEEACGYQQNNIIFSMIHHSMGSTGQLVGS